MFYIFLKLIVTPKKKPTTVYPTYVHTYFTKIIYNISFPKII